MSETWSAPCPLCEDGELVIGPLSAAQHLASAHGIALCGVRPSGMSQRDVMGIAGFHEQLKARAAKRSK